MNWLFDEKSHLMRFFWGPICVFYYFLYKNYLRAGRGESYAKLWAPTAAVSSVAGVFFLLIHPFIFTCNFLTHETDTTLSGWREVLYLCLTFFTMHIVAARLRNHHVVILKCMSNISVPKGAVLFSIFLLFMMPLLLIAMSFGKHQFFLAAVLIPIYYAAFYFIYFRRVLKLGVRDALIY